MYKEGFQADPKGFKVYLSRDYFQLFKIFYDVLYTDFIFILYVFSLTLFSTSQYSKLDNFMVNFVHSLSTWFTHPFIFPPLFKLDTVADSLILIHGGNCSSLLDIGGYLH